MVSGMDIQYRTLSYEEQIICIKLGEKILNTTILVTFGEFLAGFSVDTAAFDVDGALPGICSTSTDTILTVAAPASVVICNNQ